MSMPSFIIKMCCMSGTNTWGEEDIWVRGARGETGLVGMRQLILRWH
jgi:hypothetical protein